MLVGGGNDANLMRNIPMEKLARSFYERRVQQQRWVEFARKVKENSHNQQEHELITNGNT
jgi:hypothetical protein